MNTSVSFGCFYLFRELEWEVFMPDSVSKELKKDILLSLNVNGSCKMKNSMNTNTTLNDTFL